MKLGGFAAVAILALSGCRSETLSPDGGSRLVRGIRSAKPHAVVMERGDAGERVVTFVAPGGVSLWAVDRRALADVLRALKSSHRGDELAKALQKYPAVPPELLARASAVRGDAPVSEPAEAALTGPLSVPFGGLHAPVKLENTGLASASGGLDEKCRETLLRPGTVGQVLAGVGRTRAVLLLDGEDLARFRACLAMARPLVDGGTDLNARELGRLFALLDAGEKEEVAVLIALGSEAAL